MLKSIGQFSGMLPKIDPVLLPDTNAQDATNCDLQSGSLDALGGLTSIQAVTGTPRDLWKMGSTWISFTTPVSVVDSAVSETHNRFFYTGDSFPKKSDDTIWTTTRRLSIVAPTTAPVITIKNAAGGDGETQAVVSYVYTLVSAWGEESAPSPVSAIETIEGNQAVTLSGLNTPAGTNNSITYKRIYRLEAGTTGAEYLYLAQIDEADTTYDDDAGSYVLRETQVDTLPSDGWDEAPDDLEGLTQAHNGMLIGYSGKDLYISEPYIPYAFPDDYVLSFDSDITGIGAFNEVIVVMSTTQTYIVTGSAPETLSVTKLGAMYSCVSQRGVVPVPNGLVFPSKQGLMFCNGATVTIITEFMTDIQWQALSPENIIGKFHNDRYYAFQNGGNTGFILNLKNGELTEFTLPSPVDTVYGVYQDASVNLLYLLVYKTDTTYAIYSFDTNSTKLTYTWKSKKFLDQYMNNCCKITGDFASGTVTFKLYQNAVLVQTKTVSSESMFRLAKCGYNIAREIQLEGSIRINLIQLAPTPKELV